MSEAPGEVRLGLQTLEHLEAARPGHWGWQLKAPLNCFLRGPRLRSGESKLKTARLRGNRRRGRQTQGATVSGDTTFGNQAPDRAACLGRCSRFSNGSAAVPTNLRLPVSAGRRHPRHVMPIRLNPLIVAAFVNIVAVGCENGRPVATPALSTNSNWLGVSCWHPQFNGRDLSGFYTRLVDNSGKDPASVRGRGNLHLPKGDSFAAKTAIGAIVSAHGLASGVSFTLTGRSSRSSGRRMSSSESPSCSRQRRLRRGPFM